MSKENEKWTEKEFRRISEVLNGVVEWIFAKLGEEFEIEVSSSFTDYPAWLNIKIKRYEDS